MMPVRRALVSPAAVAAGLALLGLAFASPAPARDVPGLRAGAAAVDVTPTEFPVNMVGNFGPNMAHKAHDPLYARALVLDDGKTQVALVVVDNLGVDREVIDDAERIACRKCPLLPENILVSSTHTHTAPASNVAGGPKEAVAYRKVLVDGIAAAVVRAHANLRPAEVGAAAHPLPEEVFNRRWYLKTDKAPVNPFGGTDRVKTNPDWRPEGLLRPAGPTDPDVSVIDVRDAKSHRPLALYANYTLHYVGGTPAGAVSADYFGEFARLMPRRLGAKADGSDGFVAMLSNGASGDINNAAFGLTPPRPPREPFEQVRIVAGKTADAAWHARNKIAAYRSDVRLGVVERQVSLRRRQPTPEQVERARAIIDLKDPAERAKLPPLADPYARRALALAEAGETLKVPLQAVRIGDTAVCAIPFEAFVEIGLELKRRSPFGRTVVVGIANGYNGYLPTPEHHKVGGYETWLGTNWVQEDASVVITDRLLEMLAGLAKQK